MHYSTIRDSCKQKFVILPVTLNNRRPARRKLGPNRRLLIATASSRVQHHATLGRRDWLGHLIFPCSRERQAENVAVDASGHRGRGEKFNQCSSSRIQEVIRLCSFIYESFDLSGDTNTSNMLVQMESIYCFRVPYG